MRWWWIAALWAAGAVATGGAARPAARRTPMPAATAPAAATCPVDSRPAAELAVACQRQADVIRRQMPDRLRAIVDSPFVVAGDMSAGELENYARWSVVRPAKAMWAAYFRRKPDKVITVLLFNGGEGYSQYAKRDYPDGGAPYFGYYMPTDRRMVMNIKTGTGTLVHELTHALIIFDFPGVPTWFNEGLASLHEQCNVQEEQIVGLVNWRLPALQAAIAKGALRPLKDLITQRDFYGPQQGLNYAQARYFCMYMQHKGLLGRFYEHYCGRHSGTDAAVQAVETVFDKKLPEIEQEFIAWVRTLTWGPQK